MYAILMLGLLTFSPTYVRLVRHHQLASSGQNGLTTAALMNCRLSSVASITLWVTVVLLCHAAGKLAPPTQQQYHARA